MHCVSHTFLSFFLYISGNPRFSPHHHCHYRFKKGLRDLTIPLMSGKNVTTTKRSYLWLINLSVSSSSVEMSTELESFLSSLSLEEENPRPTTLATRTAFLNAEFRTSTS
eukprot:Lithocolla_globosa_v1_NODE_11783_length_483_cov_4.177570.p1 type:complete len:110 gc:universal NODE_11783_length_483_cov_4.177570:56-385(+)